tara:strand:- start:340 stop:624 length:285 start_codon:yes stop_codon:yes gene_type:complete
MPSKEKIIDIIFRCAEELNRQLSEERKLILEESTVIAGKNSPLDSLGLVTLMVCIEGHLNHLGIRINILDKVSESSNFPFTTIGEMSLWLLGEI